MMKKDQKKVKLIYLTPKQAEFLNARQKRKALVAGRGFGKTHVAGHHLYRLFRNLPTGKSLLVSTTYYQLLTKTCPEVESSWKDYGIQEYDPKKKENQFEDWTPEELDEVGEPAPTTPITSKPKSVTENQIEQGTEIDFSGLVKKDYDVTKPKFAEGGAVQNVDPVSGNEVPPGSLPQEVRDDVDAKLSEGEYVLPADVVRYFGLDYIEKLVNKAKQGMEEFQV